MRNRLDIETVNACILIKCFFEENFDPEDYPGMYNF